MLSLKVEYKWEKLLSSKLLKIVIRPEYEGKGDVEKRQEEGKKITPQNRIRSHFSIFSTHSMIAEYKLFFYYFKFVEGIVEIVLRKTNADYYYLG